MTTHCLLWFSLSPPSSLGRNTLGHEWPSTQDLIHLISVTPLSISSSCMDFPPGLVNVLLLPRLEYITKHHPHFTSSRCSWTLLPLSDAGNGSDVRLPSLCPVRVLMICVDRAVQWCRSHQLFVCFSGKNNGAAFTKQRMSHLVVEAASEVCHL